MRVRWLDAAAAVGARDRRSPAPCDAASIDDSDLAVVPPGSASGSSTPPAIASDDMMWPVLAWRDGALARIDRAVHFDVDCDAGRGRPSGRGRRAISYRSSREPADTALAEAALRAALDAGVPWSDFERRIADRVGGR